MEKPTRIPEYLEWLHNRVTALEEASKKTESVKEKEIEKPLLKNLTNKSSSNSYQGKAG